MHPRSTTALGFILFCALVAGTAQAGQSYLMWQIPDQGVELPVYVYRDGTQVAFIPSTSLQVFVGGYDPTSTSSTHELYYQASSTWHQCNFVLKDGAVDTALTTCPGAVVNPPVTQNGATSNVYTAVVAAIPWPTAGQAPANPVKTDYSQRLITFTNMSDKLAIQIGESCSTSNGQNTAPSCQTTPTLQMIGYGESHTITVGPEGLDSAAFYISSYCTAATLSACGTPPTAAECAGTTPSPPADWVCTGGYFAGQQPFATKIEPTILPVTNGIPDGASNVDVSAVDGFNFGVELSPSPGQYCTYTVPPENSNVLGAGYYGDERVLAYIKPLSSDALEQQCKSSSQLPGTTSAGAWNLLKTDSAGHFEGCLSPCSYAKLNVDSDGITQDTVDRFCCSGQYDTPETCVVARGHVGANTSSYNTNIVTSDQFGNVYGFAYGDAGSDYSCPPETNFSVVFVSM